MLPGSVAEAIRRDHPGIRRTARVQLGFPETVQGVESGEEYVAAVDPAFLQVFSFPMAGGDAATALDDPASVVLTSPTSRRLFGDEDPLGQRITLRFARDDYSVRPPRQISIESQRVVTGLLAPIPTALKRWLGAASSGTEGFLRWTGAVKLKGKSTTLLSWSKR